MTGGLPRELRRCLCQGRRVAVDWITGERGRIVSPNGAHSGTEFSERLTLRQTLLPTEYIQEKRHNLELGRGRIENLPIPPGGIFSFWRLIGRPTRKRGFQAGRSLLGGELRTDYGGGLCQLSGGLYHLSLIAGLRILERHAHSVDIYDDATRYTPLGADATVAYGFKDLRIENSLPAPICFRIAIGSDDMTFEICSVSAIQPCQIEFTRTRQTDGTATVETRRRRPEQVASERVAISTYRWLSSNPIKLSQSTPENL